MADGRAWLADWAAHAGWLRRVLAARLSEAHAVDEALQDVALAATRQGTPPTSPTAWLYRVAVKTALARRRKFGRDRRRAEGFARQPSPPGAAEPLDWLLAAERRDRVREALARLAPRTRELLLLKYAENWTAKQIAERLALRTEAVDARLHRARAALRCELLAMGEDHER